MIVGAVVVGQRAVGAPALRGPTGEEHVAVADRADVLRPGVGV